MDGKLPYVDISTPTSSDSENDGNAFSVDGGMSTLALPHPPPPLPLPLSPVPNHTTRAFLHSKRFLISFIFTSVLFFFATA